VSSDSDHPEQAAVSASPSTPDIELTSDIRGPPPAASGPKRLSIAEAFMQRTASTKALKGERIETWKQYVIYQVKTFNVATATLVLTVLLLFTQMRSDLIDTQNQLSNLKGQITFASAMINSWTNSSQSIAFQQGLLSQQTIQVRSTLENVISTLQYSSINITTINELPQLLRQLTELNRTLTAHMFDTANQTVTQSQSMMLAMNSSIHAQLQGMRTLNTSINLFMLDLAVTTESNLNNISRQINDTAQRVSEKLFLLNDSFTSFTVDLSSKTITELLNLSHSVNDTLTNSLQAQVQNSIYVTKEIIDNFNTTVQTQMEFIATANSSMSVFLLNLSDSAGWRAQQLVETTNASTQLQMQDTSRFLSTLSQNVIATTTQLLNDTSTQLLRLNSSVADQSQRLIGLNSTVLSLASSFDSTSLTTTGQLTSLRQSINYVNSSFYNTSLGCFADRGCTFYRTIPPYATHTFVSLKRQWCILSYQTTTAAIKLKIASSGNGYLAMPCTRTDNQIIQWQCMTLVGSSANDTWTLDNQTDNIYYAIQCLSDS